MSEDVKPPSPEGAPEPAAAVEPPSDFRAYNKWRDTGELPQTEEAPPAAAAPEPQAKTEPQSGADDSQPSGEEGEEEDRRPNSRVRRIDRLTRENELLRQQLAAVQPPKSAQPEAPKPAEAPGKPRLHDFPTLEAYQEALTDWKLDQREAAKRADAERQEAEAAAQKLQTAWQNSEQSARTAHPDYDDIVQSVRAPDGPGVPAMRQAMLEDDAGGEILYYLATHPDEMKRIAALPPISAVREIGKLSAKVPPSPPNGGNPKQKQVSGAPKPPPSLSRPSSASQKDDIHDEALARDFPRWNKAREAQLKG